jgi:hypothetical protein
MKVRGCALGLPRFNFGKSPKVSPSPASFAPNKSFKPTPHRGVNSVLYATLHALATPLWGGLTPALGTSGRPSTNSENALRLGRLQCLRLGRWRRREHLCFGQRCPCSNTGQRWHGGLRLVWGRDTHHPWLHRNARTHHTRRIHLLVRRACCWHLLPWPNTRAFIWLAWCLTIRSSRPRIVASAACLRYASTRPPPRCGAA